MALIGIDEVGRGCWAGPLLVCGVRIEESLLSGLKDSKQLSKVRRKKLTVEIKQQAENIVLAWVQPQYIDMYGLTASMEYACRTVFSSLFKQGDSIIIDGNINYLKDVPQVQTMIKGDENIPAVAAASIIAKVSRDSYMEAMNIEYPQYNFDSHVGYGTQAHIAALESHGICAIHRRSYKPIQKYETV